MSSMPWADKLQDRIDALEEELAEALAVLKLLEWAGVDEGGNSYCLCCESYEKSEPHATDCRLAAILKEE